MKKENIINNESTSRGKISSSRKHEIIADIKRLTDELNEIKKIPTDGRTRLEGDESSVDPVISYKESEAHVLSNLIHANEELLENCDVVEQNENNSVIDIGDALLVNLFSDGEVNTMFICLEDNIHGYDEASIVSLNSPIGKVLYQKPVNNPDVNNTYSFQVVDRLFNKISTKRIQVIGRVNNKINNLKRN